MVGLQILPAAVDLFVIMIETATLTSNLPDTVLTLLDSCIGLAGSGY